MTNHMTDPLTDPMPDTATNPMTDQICDVRAALQSFNVLFQSIESDLFIFQGEQKDIMMSSEISFT